MKKILLFLFISGFLKSYELPVKIYKNSDGLPQSQVRAIEQSKDGEIFFGTLGGVGIYDGKSFRRIGLKNGLPTDEIQCLSVDENGVLWIGTTLGIAKFYDEKVEKFPLGKGTDVEILKLKARNGKIYFLNRDGLYLIEKDTLKFISPADTFNVFEKTLVITIENEIIIYEGLEKKALKIPIKENKIQVIEKIEDEFFIGTDKGLYSYDIKKNKLNTLLKDYSIVDILKDSSGHIWVATSQEGIFYKGDGQWYHYTNFEGLPFDIIYCLFEDREKNIWFGSINGAGKVAFRNILIFGKTEELESLYVNSIYQKSDGTIWVGYRTGISKFDKEKLVFEKYYSLKLAKTIVRAISEDLNGNLLIGTHDHGIFIEKGKEFEPLLYEGKEKVERVYSMVFVPNKGTYIGTRKGLYFWDGENLKRYGREEGLSAETIYTVSVSPEGIIYLGTQKGIWTFDGKHFRYPEEYKIIDCEVNVLFFSSDGTLWAGTHGMGLYHFFEGNFEIFNEENGFPNDFIWGIAEGQKGKIWVATNSGIHILNNGYWITLNSKNGLPGDEIFIHTCFKDKDGNLWFGFPKGLVFLSSAQTFENLVEPSLKLRKIQTPLRVMTKIPERLVLKPRERRLHLDYIGISLQDEEEVMYQIFLKGYDEEWNPPTKENTINYANLKPGKYQFWIKSRNNAGLWTKPKLLFTFEVLPFFYEKILFKLGFLMLLLVGIITIFYLRINAINKAKIRLEEMVKERTIELQNKIKLIEELSNVDPLTEIYNRRYFISRFEKTLQLGKRHGEHFCFVLIDLDNFKEINEKHGHLFGDKVLIEFSKLLKKSFRETDIPARYGGDEFVLLLPKADPEGVKGRLEALLEEVQYHAFEIEGKSIFLSFSAGVVGVYPKPYSNFNFDDISSFTDSLLFQAKKTGKGFIIMENFPG